MTSPSIVPSRYSDDIQEDEVLASIKEGVGLRPIESSLKRIQIHRSFLDSIRPSITRLELVGAELNEIHDQVLEASKAIGLKLETAKSLTKRLELFQNDLNSKREELLEAESRIERNKLSEEEIARLHSCSITSAQFLNSLEKFDRFLSLEYLPSDSFLRASTENRIMDWFNVENIEKLNAELVEPQFAVLTKVLLKTDKRDVFLHKYIKGRSDANLRGLQQALEAGGPGRRPIDISSHSSVRYSTDMLAWMHETFLNELELTTLLFSDLSCELLSAQILLPVAQIIADRIKAASQKAPEEELAVSFNLLLLVQYYLEWFQLRLPSALGFEESSLTLLMPLENLTKNLTSQVGARSAVLDKALKIAALNTKGDFTKFVLAFVKQLVAVQQVYHDSLGPSNADRLFGSLQENLIIGFIEALESLKGNSVDTVITRLDSLGLFQSLTGNNEALLGQISNPLKVNVELMVKMAIEDLLNVAMIPNETASLLYTIDNETALEDQGQVSALSGALENLAKTFVIHSGWDWERVVGGLESFEQRQTIRKAATEKILDMYEKVWKVIGKGQTTEGAQGESKIHPPKAIKPLFE